MTQGWAVLNVKWLSPSSLFKCYKVECVSASVTGLIKRFDRFCQTALLFQKFQCFLTTLCLNLCLAFVLNATYWFYYSPLTSLEIISLLYSPFSMFKTGELNSVNKYLPPCFYKQSLYNLSSRFPKLERISSVCVKKATMMGQSSTGLSGISW